MYTTSILLRWVWVGFSHMLLLHLLLMEPLVFIILTPSSINMAMTAQPTLPPGTSTHLGTVVGLRRLATAAAGIITFVLFFSSTFLGIFHLQCFTLRKQVNTDAYVIFLIIFMHLFL